MLYVLALFNLSVVAFIRSVFNADSFYLHNLLYRSYSPLRYAI